MSKKKHKIKSEEVSVKKVSKSFGLSAQKQNWLFLGLLLISLLILNKPTALDGLAPQGTDVVAGVGKSHLVNQHRKTTGEQVYWNPAIFAGMPKYNDIGPQAFSVDNVLSSFNNLAGNIFIYYIFAAIGMFLFLRYLKMPPLVAFIGALMFVLLPHYKGLWIEGHFRKFRAIMYLPWIIYSFKYFLDKKTLLATALFALAFGIQIRTGHYQIIFYTGMLLFSVGLYPIIKLLLDGKIIEFGKSTGLLFLALILALSMSAQPLLLNKEYLPYSKRGKTTINLNDKVKKEASSSDGVSMQYATQWSTHPMELMRIVIPHAYGGIDGEKYTGKDFPQLKNKNLPNYWGFMPFHTLFDYVGIITLLLAFIALFVLWENNFVVSLGLFALFLILLSFGRHFESFYALFYNYFPFFNKFRAPAMSVTVTSFVFVILATYGLNYLSTLKIERPNFKQQKNIFYVIGGFLFLGILIWVVSGSFDFMKPTENYNPQVKEMLKKIRQSYFDKDLMRYLGILIIVGISITAYLYKKISFTALGIIVLVVVSFDLISVQKYYGEEYSRRSNLDRVAFQKTSVDNYLEQDDALFRIFPIGQLMGDNRWGYNTQTIGGYSAIKMYTIEELVQNCYYGGVDKNFPINWNVMSFLNVKYLVLQQAIANPNLTLVNADNSRKLFLYRYNKHLPRGFFVSKTEVIKNEYERLEKINSTNFDATQTAILEESLTTKVFTPDSSNVTVLDFNPNKLSLDVFTDRTSLLVISELFYPPGWKIYIDEKKVDKIYKTDHAVMSIVIPKGNHKVDVICHPDSYFFYKNVSWASVSIIYLIILISLFFTFRREKLLKKNQI